MSSVTRFLRQIPTGASYVNPDSLTSSALDFVPSGGNYVGNYPPGYMVPAAQTGLSTALSNAKLVANGQFLLRDMGKTIFAPFVATVGASTTAAPSSYFREYQLLVVTPITAAQGFIGGVSGNTFGVVGASAATAPGTSTYATFYLPVSIGGIGSAAPAVAALPVINTQAGGQM
jgi:hypothetical protein